MTDHDRHDEIDPGDGTGGDVTEALLGAYVLDAVDEVERRRVERLLETSTEARAEVERLNAAADALAEASLAGARAPHHLFGSLMARIAERGSEPAGGAPTPPPAVDPVVPPRRPEGLASADVALPGDPEVVPFERPVPGARRSRTPWILSAAAVLVLFVVGAVVLGNRDDGVTDSAAAMEEMAAEAAAMPGARTGALTDAENTMAVQVVVDPDGHAFVMSGVLPALDSDHTYQLWSVDGGTPVSLGLLGPDPTMSVVGVDAHVHTLAITMEPMGGSPGPTTEPMASGTLGTA